MKACSGAGRKNAYVNLALCILLWASIPVITKKMLLELNSLQILFYSTALSTLVMAILALSRKKAADWRQYGKKEYAIMAGLGLLGNYLYYLFLYGALSKTTAAEGFILAYTWPILVLLLSVVFGTDKLTVKKLAGMLVSFCGIIIITTQGELTQFNLTNLNGDLLAIVGAFVFALFSVLAKRFDFDKIISVFIYFLSAFMAIVPTVLAFSTIPLPGSDVWPWIIFNGVFVNGISYVFWFKALAGGETHILSNLLYVTPFISLLYIALFLNEPILPSAIAGAVVIVSGVLFQYAKK
ncbi:DMT family transporter [Azotosporobacter soli]|uniref:DMT family transporter n=1 Tax=Azotosporobacter soli TaxID=3055040 RepID=UPI0031FF2D73